MPLVPRIPGYHLPFSRRIKAETGLLTMAPGMITQAVQAEQCLRERDTDLIAMARELICHGDWPMHAARELGLDNPLSLLPPDFAQRLQGRDAQKTMAVNRAVT